MSSLGLMNATATIERATPAVGATGVVTLTWSQSAANVRCALQLRDGDSRQYDPGLVTVCDGVVYLPPNADIRPGVAGGPGDRVTIAGTTYLVTHVRALGIKMVRAELRRVT